MKKIFLLFLFLLSLFSCKENKNTISLTNEYATNFSLEEKDNQWIITSAGNITKIPKNTSIKNCIITTTSVSAYIDALGKFTTITGICSPQYFYNPEVSKGIKDNSIQDIGNDASLNFEKIISLKPELIITTHNPNYEKTLNQLARNGIKVLYVEEYNELHPLGKTEYLKLFGLLFQEQEKADSLYNQIKDNYLLLAQKARQTHKKPTVFTSIMYGDSWYMAGGKSFVAQLFNDAGADYLWKDSPKTGTISISFEEVLSKARNADYWIGASNFKSKKELLSSNYKWFKAFTNDKVYTMNARENDAQANDYYESGSIYSDKALKDIIKILQPELFPDEALTYLKKLN